MPEYIPINPEVLIWARERSGYSVDEMEKKFSKYVIWEKGEGYPTYAQLENVANAFNRPIAIFFFPNPPSEPSIEKSFRALSEESLHNLSPHMRVLFRKAQSLQLSLGEIFSTEEELQRSKLTWLNSNDYDLHKSPGKLREILGVDLNTQISWKNPDDALENWREALSNNGIYVFKDAFHDDSISGFCIYDELFPIVFLNNSVHKNRQIFTLFHEIGHLISRQSYLDVFDSEFWNIEFEEPSNIEVSCNAFAANFLVPENDFLQQVQQHIDQFNLTDNIDKLASRYKVSKEVILRRLLTYNIINKSLYMKTVTEWNKLYKKQKTKDKGAGGNYYFTQLAYLGESYCGNVLKMYHQGKINLEQASSYLNIKPKSFVGLESAYLNKGA